MERTWDFYSARRPDFFRDYYQVSMDPGPIVVCDDWTTTPQEMWCSYVVFPYGEIM